MLARLGGRGSSIRSIVISAASPQVYLRLRVCVGDVQLDGLVSVLPVLGRPEDFLSGDDDVHPQVPVCSEWFAALHLVWKFRAASTYGRMRGEVVGAGSSLLSLLVLYVSRDTLPL